MLKLRCSGSHLSQVHLYLITCLSQLKLRAELCTGIHTLLQLIHDLLQHERIIMKTDYKNRKSKLFSLECWKTTIDWRLDLTNKKKGQVFHGKWARNVKTDRDYGNLLLSFPLFRAPLGGDNASVHCLDNWTWFCTSSHGMSGQRDHCLLHLAVMLHTPCRTEYFYPQHHTVKDFGTEGVFFCRMFTIS